MELKDFAERLLIGKTLADKLLSPDLLLDEQAGGSPLLPDEPGRPDALALPRRGSGAKIPMPSLLDLDRPEVRGRILHQFANHELLALELMALALLKFPDAPAKFRRGLAATIAEEQKHMRLYMERMNHYGVRFGEVPVSRFFWDAVSGMPSPLAFVAQMSLTLEQANLDFSLHYRDLFTRLGDLETAAVLDTVYQEEIGHVRLGLAWFNRWRDPEQSEWNAYVAALPPPLTPGRAKGLGYSAEARRAAGLSEGFIAELAVHNQSKGRPSDVYYFNPGCEDEVADGRGSVTLPRHLAALQGDLASVLLFVANPTDVVIVPRRPATEFLATLVGAGFELPQIVEDASVRTILADRRLGRFLAWGRSPAADFHRQKMRLNCRDTSPPPADLGIFAKTWSVQVHRDLSPETCNSYICRTLAELETALQQVTALQRAVIKAPLGSSGRHMHQVTAAGLTPPQRAWSMRILAEQGAVVVEPWLNKILDLSVQIEAGAKDPILGLTRFVTDRRGQYAGHLLGRKFDDLAPEDRRIVHTAGFFEHLYEVGRGVAQALAKAGYTGAAGIDALVHRGDDGLLRLRPIVEINTRFTMGRVALALDEHLNRGCRAAWRHLSLKQVQALGHQSFAACAQSFMTAFPLATDRGGITAGILATNDPGQATGVLTLLAVGDAAIAASSEPTARPAPKK